MIAFLVVDRVPNAAAYGMDHGWVRLSAVRYATPGKNDVRAVERVIEVPHVSGGANLIRGPGFNENAKAQDFEALVERGGGRWVDVT